MTDLPTIPGCNVDKLVASSSVATVVRATRGTEIVAVKVYRSSSHLPAFNDQRVRREELAQRQIEHPCVARLIDAGCLPTGEPYLVSAWIDGPRLEDRLARGALTVSETVSILRALAAGLVAIHARDIIHRDLKPANIILPFDSPSAVILDFGHSLLSNEQRLTDTGVILGSACYMAPEYASGAPIDARADLYALGVILYRCLTGVLPFDDRSDAEVLLKHQHEPVIPPRERDRTIPQPLEDLCMWLLAKDPAARVPNAHVLEYTLRAMRSDNVALSGSAWQEQFA